MLILVQDVLRPMMSFTLTSIFVVIGKNFFGVANSFQEAFTLINNYCDGVAEEIYTDYELSDQQKLSLLFKLYCLSAENRDHPCFIPNENEGYKGKKSR